MTAFKVLTLNEIAVAGLERLARDRYEVASEVSAPDAILVRSADMLRLDIPQTLKAVARAGAGVNNIPVDRLSGRGIPVFNAPGANANAVKELVIAGLLLAARNIVDAWDFVRGCDLGAGDAMARVESAKKRFIGTELPERTLGVIGLGAVGVRVANAALTLGMRVHGYDPKITVSSAWQLDSAVRQASSVGDLLAGADYVSLHVPLLDGTRRMIDAERLALMREGAVLLNFARASVVDEEAVREALGRGRLRAYVTDFPSPRFQGVRGAIMLPHIGASTREAENNCAVVAVEALREFLEQGNIRRSVNFPEVVMPAGEGHRIAVVNANVPNMLGQISTTLASAGLNILDMVNRSRGAIAYTLANVDRPADAAVIESLRVIEGVVNVRAL